MLIAQDGDTVVVTIEGVTVRLDPKAASAAANRLASHAVNAADFAARQAHRARADEVIAQFRSEHPDCIEVQGKTLGPLLLSPSALDTWGYPWALVCREGQKLRVPFSEIPSFPLIWLVDVRGRRAHAWRGGPRTVCGDFKDRNRGFGPDLPHCRRCEAVLEKEVVPNEP